MAKKNNIAFLWVLIPILLLSLSGMAQIDTPDRPKKIGVVLSGGGAKGLAHIGALKVIDSLGIKVDYIAGTSMGAIVGSLYAAGYSGRQLDSIFKKTDFDKLISDDIPRSSKSYFERQESERYAATLPFKDFKVALPNSLSKGQNIYNFLSRLLAHVRDVDNFEDLPIPFFCIATNIETGEEVLLDAGNLPKAVNASGALPSLFAPVALETLNLIDGGVTNNYPVEALRAKGMDIIIGVDVQDGLRTITEINGALDILTQINNFRTIESMGAKRKLTDVYIAPDIAGFTVVSFNRGKEIIKKGELAAQKKAGLLATFKTPGFIKQDLSRGTLLDSIHVTAVSINGNDNYSRSFIRGRFDFKIPESISYNDINDGINRLQATTDFSKINYEIKPTETGSRLDLEVVENPVRNSLKFGVHYDELLRSAALINLTRKKVLFDNDILSADLILGDNVRYNLDYYIDKGNYWSVGFHSEFVQYDKLVNAVFASEASGLELAVNSIDINYNDWTQQLYLQTRLANDVYVTAGIELKKLRIFTETLATSTPDDRRTIFENNSTGSVYGKALFDSYDTAFFPSSGWKIEGDFHLYLVSSDINNDFNEFSIAQVSVGRAIAIFNNLSIRGDLFVGLPIGDPGNSSLDFFLGGYGARRINNNLAFYGYDFISLGGNTVMKSLFELDWELFKKNHLVLSANLANVDDDLFEQNDWFNKARYTGYAIGYGIETFLGPIELKYSFTPQQAASEFYVNLGFSF
jgi:NTE family protein